MDIHMHMLSSHGLIRIMDSTASYKLGYHPGNVLFVVSDMCHGGTERISKGSAKSSMFQ